MRTRSRQKQQQRLKVRKVGHKPHPKYQGATTEPGSQNVHKSASLSTKLRQNKKGNRR